MTIELGQLVRILLGFLHILLKIKDGVVLRPYLTVAEVPVKNELDYR